MNSANWTKMRHGWTVIVMMTFVMSMASCKKDKNPYIPPPPPSAVLLKDIVIPNLPSPYYHFEYNESGRLTKAAHASGLRSYDVVYTDGFITELRNNTTANKDRLVYIYNNNSRVEIIKYVDENGIVFRRAYLDYNNGQLQRIEWERKVDVGYAIERIMLLTYYADGNLAILRNQTHAIPGIQDELLVIDKFEHYDNKINADGFSLLHVSNNHLLLVPGVTLQHNNARKVTRAGAGINYIIDYTYTYNDKNAPLTRTGDAIFTSGPNNGQRFQTNASFTYY